MQPGCAYLRKWSNAVNNDNILLTPAKNNYIRLHLYNLASIKENISRKRNRAQSVFKQTKPLFERCVHLDEFRKVFSSGKTKNRFQLNDFWAWLTSQAKRYVTNGSSHSGVRRKLALGGRLFFMFACDGQITKRERIPRTDKSSAKQGERGGVIFIVYLYSKKVIFVCSDKNRFIYYLLILLTSQLVILVRQ